MMRKLPVQLLLVSALHLLLLTTVYSQQQTIVNDKQREGADHAREAEAFNESLHIVPEGMNWKRVNEAVRNSRTQRLRKGDAVQQADVEGHWSELGSNNQSGRVVAVDVDDTGDSLYVAGAGGTIWKGAVNGTGYRILNEFQKIEYPKLVKHIRLRNGSNRIVAISNQPRVMYLDDGMQLFAESEGFEEYQRWGNIDHAVWCNRGGRLELYLIGSEWDYSEVFKARKVLYRSIDSARSFQRLKWFDGANGLWTDNAQTVLLVHGDTISSVLPDGTLSVTGTNAPWKTQTIILAGTSTNELVAGVVGGGKTIFHVSEDAGASWFQTGEIGDQPFHRASFCMPNSNVEDLFFGAVDVWKSEDFGGTWERVSSWGEYYASPATKLHADIPSILGVTSPKRGRVTYVCTDGGLYESFDGFKTVNNLSLAGLNVSQYYGSYTNRDNVEVVSAGSQDQGFQRSRVDELAGPRDFEQMISGDYARLSSGDGGASLFCVYPGFVLYWSRLEFDGSRVTLDFPHTRHLWLPPLAVSPLQPKTAFLGGGRIASNGARLYTYTVNGNAMIIDSVGQNFGESTSGTAITAVHIAENDPSRMYVVTSSGFVFTSNNLGATFTKHPRPEGLDGHYFGGNALVSSPTNSSRVYLGGSGYGRPAVWVSNDAGATFDSLPGLPPVLVYSLAVSSDGNLVAAATDAGAFMYNVGQRTWTDITQQGGPDQTYWHVEWIAPLQRFRFSTYGRGLWDFMPTNVTSVQTSKEGYSLTVYGTFLGGVSGVSVVGASGQTEIVWYEVTGRELARENVLLGEEKAFLARPNGIPPGTMAVVTDSKHRVGAAVTP